MAGNVTGSIGADNVNLNNAATESTLAALLKVAQADSKNLLELAKKAGVDAASLKDFDDELKKSAEAQVKNTQATIRETDALEKASEKHARNVAILSQLDASMMQLMNGTAQMSDVFGAFKNVGPVIGTIAAGFERLASIQQQNFESYQKLSESGISFGGSLTDLRLAAANSYMTLDGFATLMKNNSTTFAKFGGSANEGAMGFAKFSKSILSSGVGDQLMALGYTADEANQSMATYLGAAGVSNAKDLESNQQLRSGAADYLNELDRLSQVTGKSRKEQEETMKKQKLDAEIQMTAAKIKDPADRAKFEANVKYMTEMYGDAGKDMALAQAQHRSVVTEEGKTLAALSPGMTAAMDKMAKAQLGSKEYIDAQNEMSLAAQKGLGRVPLAAYSTSDSLKKLSQAQLTVAGQEMAGLTTKEALNARDLKVAQDQKARADSQANDMAQANKGLKDLGAALWTAFSPLISPLTALLGYLGQFAGWLANVMNKGGLVTTGFVALGAAIAMITAWKAKEFVLDKAKSVGGSLMSSAAGAAGGAGGGGGGPLNAIGKAGGGVGGALEGLAKGLTAFANPVILLGATILAGSLAILITGVGAGIAATMALIGLALPTFSTGLKTLSEVDSSKFGSLALGLGELGLGLIAFGPFAVFGIPAGIALNSLADGIVKLNGVDPTKLEAVANALQKVKDATPSSGEIIRIGLAALATKALPSSEKTSAAPTTTASPAGGESGNNVASEIKTLNNMTSEMLKLMRENVDYMKRNVSAIKELHGNGLKF